MSEIKIADLMEKSKVKFGTSGARGLVTDMTDWVCFAYTLGFIQYLEGIGELTTPKTRIAVAGDLRPSTPRIMKAVFKAIEYKGYTPINSGLVPSPAVACYGLQYQVPAVMVTGSHIPDDRNGIKYNKASGEILKVDEIGLKEQVVTQPVGLFDSQGHFLSDAIPADLAVDKEAESLYIQRYLNIFPSDFLSGKKVGFYQHSLVGRDLLPQILESLGAEVLLFGYSKTFMPVDTEAIRPEDVQLAEAWAKENPVDALFSTDGDSDRPLIGDENGKWLRGDVAGILTSLYLKADSVSTPVSCNTALEKSKAFSETRRTRIGSPFVIESMMEAEKAGYQRVVGYEANGGYFTQSSLSLFNKDLKPLPTRDTLIVFLSILGLSLDQKVPVSQVVKSLPPRFTASGRLEDFPTETSQSILKSFRSDQPDQNKEALQTAFENKFGSVVEINNTDGLRATFENGEIIHLRPSGNAPEFRCYNEADTETRVNEMNTLCLSIMSKWKENKV